MSEYKEGDPIWIPGSVWWRDESKELIGMRETDTVLNQSTWRPRAEGVAPDALREAAEEMLRWFTYQDDLFPSLQGRIDDLRAALDATPVGEPITQAEALRISRRISEQAENRRNQAVERVGEPPVIEGPVQVGDRVRIEGDVVEIHEEYGTAVIRVPTTGLRTVWLFDLTIVSRPAPKRNTCGGCRWFDAEITVDDPCRHSAGYTYPEPVSLACNHYAPWPPEGGA